MFRKNLVAVATLGIVAGAYASPDVGTMTLNVGNPFSKGEGGVTCFLNNVSVGGFAGLLNFTEADTTNPGNSLGPIVCFCADLVANFPPPTAWNALIYDPTSTFGIANITAAGNMVAGVAATLGGNLTLLTNEQAFALQMDVWEAIYDGVGGATPNFGGGSFKSFDAKLTPTALADANAYWAYAATATNSIFIKANGGIGDPNHTGQDMLTVRGGGTHVFTPEPVTMSLGLAGIGMFLRRRAAKKA